MSLYRQLADEIQRGIREGVFVRGRRLPSVRDLQQRRGLSASTILHAYAELERRGWVEAHPRSGYFVAHRPLSAAASAPAASSPTGTSTPVEVSDLVFDILGATRERRLLPFGSAFPSPVLFPLDRLAVSLARSARRMEPWDTVADLPPGSTALRQQILRRYLLTGVDVALDEVLITNGAMEALNLCLQAVAAPGEVIAIESPAFYGPLQAIERLGLRAVEVRTDPQLGVDPQALREVLDTHAVRACWFMSSFQNPLGASVPEAQRSEIVALLAERQIPLIEDDVYAELYFGKAAQKPFKHFDREGLVLHCGGFAKCLAPGFRVGWVSAGRYSERVRRLKMTTTLATSMPSQEALADFLQRSGFEAHLRRLRRVLQQQQTQMLDLITRHFPPGTQATQAQGGYFTWVTLPQGIDALRLHGLAAAEGIGLSPGPMFSPQRGYTHCLRLNYGHPWDDALRAGIARMGALAVALASR